MEKGPNFSNDAESSTEKKDGKSKRSDKKFVAPLPFAPEKQRETKPESIDQTANRPIIPESLLSKLTGEKDEPKVKAEASAERQADKVDEPSAEAFEAAENTKRAAETQTAETSEAFAKTLEDQYVESIAEDLSEGQEISLQEAGQVSESRDSEIIEKALDHAETVESPLIAEQETVVSSVETEPSRQPTPEAPPPFILPEAGPDEEDSLPTPAASYGAPPTPPVAPELRYASGMPPVPPESRNPESGPSSGPETSSEELRRIADDAAWSERQRGRREGVFAGMLLGSGIEHFRHKRREKKVEKLRRKEERKQEKRIEKLEFDYTEARKAQATEKLASEAQAVAYATAERATQQHIEKNEQDIAREKKAAEQARREAQESEMSAEELALPKDHHIEHSAWHAIEVDKEGRAVNQGAIEYGHEYYAERKHEAGPKIPVNEAAGEVALVAAAIDDARELPMPSQDTQPQQHTGPTGDSNQATRQKKSPLQALTTPPATPAGTVGWLLALVMLVIILVAVMR